MNKNRAGEQNRDPAHSPEAWSEDPFTTHIKLDRNSSVPSPFRTAGTFLRSRALSHQLDCLTASRSCHVCQLSLVSISLKSLPLHSYQVWVADKVILHTDHSRRFGVMSSISIPNQAFAGPVRRSITSSLYRAACRA